MKPRILILPAAIRSHVLPSLYVADRLAEDYEVVYAVQNDILADIVTANGYRAVKQSGHLVGYHMEPNYIASLKQKPTYWRVLKAYYTQEIYHARQRELFALLDTIRPSAILIDLFACTDYWVLYPRKKECKLLFFNPMPSTYRVKGYPIVSEGYFNPTQTLPCREDSILPFSHRGRGWGMGLLRNPKRILMAWAIQQQRKRLGQIAPLADDATVTQVIADVPELILAPLAFEFAPEIRKPHQYYLGLCMRPHRQDTELDPAFEEAWESIAGLKRKSPSLTGRDLGRSAAAEGLIYCSFGTFYEGADATLLRFMTNLLEVIATLPHVQLICSINKYVIETLRHRYLLTANTHFFSRVPQMRVLAEADVFITHAGFGSIKEAIYYGVPMLAYPLDPKYDQNGNALKLEHHGLGLRGSFAHERPNDLKMKLLRLLEEDSFREKVANFKAQLTNDTPKDLLDEQIGTETKYQSYETQPC